MKNISSFVREGENILTVKLLWHQSEETTDGLPFFRGNLIMSQTVEIQKQKPFRNIVNKTVEKLEDNEHDEK